MNKIKQILLVSLFLIMPMFAQAVNPADNLNRFIGGKAVIGSVTSTAATIANRQPGYSVDTPTPAVLVGQVLGVVYSLLGVVALILIVYAGFLWLFSQGNQDKISKALGILKSSIIGLAILFSAYLITAFIISALSG